MKNIIILITIIIVLFSTFTRATEEQKGELGNRIRVQLKSGVIYLNPDYMPRNRDKFLRPIKPIKTVEVYLNIKKEKKKH